MREFEQMEMQFFVPPGSGPEHYAFWKEERLKWHHRLGLGESNYRFHDHIKTATMLMPPWILNSNFLLVLKN